MITRITRGRGHLTVGCHFAAGDGTDRFSKCLIPGVRGGVANVMKRDPKDLASELRLGTSFTYFGAYYLGSPFHSSGKTHIARPIDGFAPELNISA